MTDYSNYHETEHLKRFLAKELDLSELDVDVLINDSHAIADSYKLALLYSSFLMLTDTLPQGAVKQFMNAGSGFFKGYTPKEILTLNIDGIIDFNNLVLALNAQLNHGAYQ